jgi:protein tyrosine phosphatase
VHVIIMLTREVEGMQVKCCNYWDSGQYGPFTLKMVQTTETVDERRSRQTQPTEFSWDLGKSSPPGPKNPTITRRLELSNKDFLSAGTRSIVQMQYLEWPDLNVPDDPRGVLDLVTNLQREVDSIVMTNPTVDNLHPDQADPNTGIVKRGLDHPPVLLHCSAGVGRTGGFIAVDAILDGVRREVRKRRAAVLRRKQERRNRMVHESSQSPPFGTDRDVEMSDSNPSPPQVSMVLDEAIDAKVVRPTDRSLVMPIHGAPHSSGEPLFHVPVAGWAREDGSSTSGGERDGDLSSQRDSPSPSEPMEIDEKESARSKLRRQKLEQSSPWTGTRRELKEWPTSGDSDRSNHLVRPHAKRMLSNESDVHQVHSDRSSSSGDYHAFASGSATGSSSGSDLNLAARLRKSVETQQLESQMTNVSVGAIRKLSPPTSVGSSSGSNYRARTTSTPGTLSSSPAPPPLSTYPSPSPKRPNHRHRQSDETTGRLSSPLGSSEGYSTGGLSVFGLPNRDETTAPSSLPSSHKRTSDEGSASAKERQHSSRSSSDRECGIRREADNVSRSPPSGTIEKTHSRPFDYADPREIFVDEETPPMLSTFGEPIRRILEDMREQRMSLCQSLRQYVFVHRAIIEGSLMIVDEEKEREKEAKFVRQYEGAHAAPKRPSLSQMRRTTSFAEKTPVPKDILSTTQPVQFISNPLLTAGSSVSISSSDHSSIGFFAPVRNAKRNASPTELKEDTTDDTDLSKRPSTKRRHTEDVKERHTRAGGLVSPVRATGSFPHSGPHHHPSAR